MYEYICINVYIYLYVYMHIYVYIYISVYVLRMMKMENIAPKARIEPTSLAFLVIVLIITLPRISDVTTLAMLPVYVSSRLRGQCRPL